MEKYNILKKKFEENKCMLITTYNEYKTYIMDENIKNKGNIRVKFIAQCGHENNVAITNFISRKTGVICKNCRYNKYSIDKKNSSINYNEQEAHGINILEDILKDKYIIQRTPEGSTLDLFLKIKNLNESVFIPVQIKTTNKKSICKAYCFKLNKKLYKNCLMICICIEERKFWVIHYNEIPIIQTLSISDKSKYNKYEVKEEDLTQIFDKYKDIYITEINISIPNFYQIREQEYINKRQQYLPFLNFIVPNTQNTRTDFIVNNKKIQEKVCLFRKDRNAICFNFVTNNGTDNGKRKFRTYKLGENDYYWFHSIISDNFWIFPQNILFEKKIISNYDENNKKTQIYVKLSEEKEYLTNEWVKKYEYNYLSIDKELILSIF
jgi:hypothetical protein